MVPALLLSLSIAAAPPQPSDALVQKLADAQLAWFEHTMKTTHRSLLLLDPKRCASGKDAEEVIKEATPKEEALRKKIDALRKQATALQQQEATKRMTSRVTPDLLKMDLRQPDNAKRLGAFHDACPAEGQSWGKLSWKFASGRDEP